MLNDLLSKARALEVSAHSSHNLNHSQQRSIQTPMNRTFVQSKGTTLCSHCGYALPHNNNVCPAQNKTCHYCGKPGHFSQVCRSRKKTLQTSRTRMTPSRSAVNVIHEQANPSSDDDYCSSLHPTTSLLHLLPSFPPSR